MKTFVIFTTIMIGSLTGSVSVQKRYAVQSTTNLEKFIQAVKEKEQGPYESNNAYEIHYVFFKDAKEQLQKEGLLTPIYYSELAYDDWLCRVVIAAYFRRHARYALETKDWYTLARIYNGGPKGYNKWKTREYAECIVNLTME